MRKRKKKQVNYLELIPLRNPEICFHEEKNGRLALEMTNKGIFHAIAQKLFHRPRISYIHMDEFASFVWRQIDGHRSIDEVANLVNKEFGEKAEPLYPRLVQHFRTLEAYDLVRVSGK